MSDKKSRMAGHHEAMSQHCSDQSEHCEAMADACDDEKMGKCFSKMSETWKAMSKCHSDEAAGIMKAMVSPVMQNRGYMVPDGISGIIPEHRVTAIPRIGQPTEISKAMIDPELEKFVEIED